MLFFGLQSSAQIPVEQDRIDSLIVRLSVLDQKPEKVDVLSLIAFEYKDIDINRSKEYANLALKLAQKISYDKGEMIAYNQLGEYALYYDVDIVRSLECFNAATRLANRIGDQEIQGKLLVNFGYFSSVIGEYEEAIQYYHLAILAEDNREINEVRMHLYGEIAENYLNLSDTISGVRYYEMIRDYENETRVSDSDHIIAHNLAVYYNLLHEYDRAISYCEKSLKISKESEDLRWLSYNYAYLGTLHLNAGHVYSAIDLGRLGLEIANKNNYNKERFDNLDLLARAYRINEDYENATNYLLRATNLSDSLYKLDEKNRKSRFQTILGEEHRQREKDNAIATLKEKQLQSEKDGQLIIAIAIGLIITSIFLFIIYRRLVKGNKLFDQLKVQKEELQKLSIVAANIEQMVMIVDERDKIEWVNKSFEQIFGYSRGETVGKTPLELLGGELTDLEKVKAMNDMIFDEKIAFRENLTQYSKSKQPYLTRLYVSPILSDTNEIERYVVISHDITAEQKIAEELKELSLVASNTTNSIVIYDKSLIIIWVNDGFTKLTGYKLSDVFGKTNEQLYTGSSFNKNDAIALDKLYKTGKPFTFERDSVNRYTNKTFWISVNVTPVYDENDEIVKYISVATDISEIKELEEQYEGLVEGSTDMIYEVDIQGKFIFVNDVMALTFGYTKDEIKQSIYLDLVHDDDKKRVELFYRNQIVKMEQTSYCEFRTITKKRDVIWVGQRAKIKLNNDNSRVIGFSVVTRDISEQKVIEENLVKTHNNAHLLSEIGMQITSTHSIPEIIHQVYDNINELMDATVFGIAIPNKEGNALVFPHIIEKGKPITDLKFDINDQSRLAVLCYNNAQEIIMGDFESEWTNYIEENHNVDPIAGELTNSIIYLPLFIRGHVIGVITVQSFAKNAYDKYQLSLMKSLASFVAIALENAGLYETMEDKIAKRTLEVRKQKEELEVNYFNTRILSEIGQLIASTLDLDKIFDELYEKVCLLMDAEIFAIRVYNEEENTIEFTHSIESGVRRKPRVISMDEVNNYNVWCVVNRKEIFINDNLAEFQNYVSEIHLVEGNLPNSLIFYPMIVEQKVIGVITIQSFKFNAYQAYHLDVLKTLASYIGTAIDNAKLYETLEHKVQIRTEELEQKNKDITASINYAKRLQKGILPDKSFMRRIMKDSFVYFKPKDIVSGDFYWVDRTKDKVLLAVVDCTGHGVPGAMMSIIGRNLLDQAVNEKGLTVPSQILNFLQVGLSIAFGQTGEKKADLFDGMDLALCSIDTKNHLLEFAGANNSLYLFQDNELIVLKGDKIGISAEYEISHFYTNVEIEIKKGDVIYLTSDGFPDQFGGERNKKFTYQRMEDLFSQIYQEDIASQADLLEKHISEWRGERAQTDDICILGVRIDS